VVEVQKGIAELNCSVPMWWEMWNKSTFCAFDYFGENEVFIFREYHA
jgi:hypothetical protein